LLEKVDVTADLDAKLKQLPEIYRLVLTLRYKDDLTLQEISEVLEIPYNTVKSQHKRALLALKKQFEAGLRPEA
jgi:RNA polymerase sigma-70 factor (ECF subfamily)